MNGEVLDRVRRQLVDAGSPPRRAALAALVRQDTSGLAGHGQLLGLVREAESELPAPVSCSPSSSRPA
jgi:hypothetical protein